MGRRKWKRRAAACSVGILVIRSLWLPFYRYHFVLEPQETVDASAGLTAANSPYCAFRRYPPHRYYQLGNMTDPYYTQVPYVYGEWPVLLNASRPTKLCLQRTNLPRVREGRKGATLAWPLTDGTNPSIVRVGRIETDAPDVAQVLRHVAPTAHYLVSTILKEPLDNTQCFWNDATTVRRTWPSSRVGYDVPDLKRAPPENRRAVVQLWDEHFALLAETTVSFQDDTLSPPQEHYVYYDDPRLFLHHRSLFMAVTSGRELHIAIHPLIVRVDKGKWTVTARWSDTMHQCCGRNMALVPDGQAMAPVGTGPTVDHHHPAWDFYTVTWIDPLTIVRINTTTNLQERQWDQQQQAQRLLPPGESAPEQETRVRRRLQVKAESLPPNSNIHGTNGFMVPFLDNQLLGMGHFHREQPGIPITFARWGHHYTHVFYTIGVTQHNQSMDHFDRDNSPLGLTALSAEFVFPSVHVAQDADGVQFASGLEYNPETQQVIVSYGINDCESAVTTINVQTVLDLLRPVATGTHVRHYMKHLNMP